MSRPEFPRRGAWAMYEGRVGIIDAITPAGASFHVVDKQGDTTLVLPNVPFAALTQATHAQIPEARRPKEDHAERLGYKTGAHSKASPVTTTPRLSSSKAPVVANLGGSASADPKRRSARKGAR